MVNVLPRLPEGFFFDGMSFHENDRDFPPAKELVEVKGTQEEQDKAQDWLKEKSLLVDPDFVPLEKRQWIEKCLTDKILELEGAGLHARQIGLPYHVCVCYIPKERPGRNFQLPRKPLVVPFVMFNPRIVKKSSERIIGPEGCYSLPGLLVFKVRYQRIVVEYEDVFWRTKRLEVENDEFLSVLCQHEIAHGEGDLISDGRKKLILQQTFEDAISMAETLLDLGDKVFVEELLQSVFQEAKGNEYSRNPFAKALLEGTSENIFSPQMQRLRSTERAAAYKPVLKNLELSQFFYDNTYRDVMEAVLKHEQLDEGDYVLESPEQDYFRF